MRVSRGTLETSVALALHSCMLMCPAWANLYCIITFQLKLSLSWAVHNGVLRLCWSTLGAEVQEGLARSLSAPLSDPRPAKVRGPLLSPRCCHM